jgi:hypothetical protein
MTVREVSISTGDCLMGKTLTRPQPAHSKRLRAAERDRLEWLKPVVNGVRSNPEQPRVR